jgi:hypothetical protein
MSEAPEAIVGSLGMLRGSPTLVGGRLPCSVPGLVASAKGVPGAPPNRWVVCRRGISSLGKGAFESAGRRRCSVT